MSIVKARRSIEGIVPDFFYTFCVDSLKVLELAIEYFPIDLLDIGGKDEDAVLALSRQVAESSGLDTF